MTQQIRQICLHEESLNHSFRTATKLIPLPLYASQQTFGQQVTFCVANFTGKASSLIFWPKGYLGSHPELPNVALVFQDSWIIETQNCLHSQLFSSLTFLKFEFALKFNFFLMSNRKYLRRRERARERLFYQRTSLRPPLRFPELNTSSIHAGLKQSKLVFFLCQYFE